MKANEEEQMAKLKAQEKVKMSQVKDEQDQRNAEEE